MQNKGKAKEKPEPKVQSICCDLHSNLPIEKKRKKKEVEAIAVDDMDNDIDEAERRSLGVCLKH